MTMLQATLMLPSPEETGAKSKPSISTDPIEHQVADLNAFLVSTPTPAEGGGKVRAMGSDYFDNLGV